MPRYELTKKMYLNQPDARGENGMAPKLLQPGTKVSYDGWPGVGMTPLDAEAKRRVEIVNENRGKGHLPKTVAEYDKAQATAAKAEKSTAKAA